MHANKIISIFILMILSSCVNIYSPKIKGSDVNKYVVTGQVKTGAQTQTVNISMTSSFSNPTYKPVRGCIVTIQDNEHHNFPMVDLGNGTYSTIVDPQYLVPGHDFRVSIVTPDGDSIVSSYETLQQVPPVDSIFYHIKDIKRLLSGNNITTQHGIQFYIDLKGTTADSRYYRWVVYETWKYHAMYPLQQYIDSTYKFHSLYPPDSSRYTCWDTKQVPEIFTVSTSNLSQNRYNDFPLQYVSNDGPKLANGYSMLVEQLALSKAAYNYWDQMRINSTRNGGLFEKQPIAIRGNLHDITHPGKDVLGFFSAESASYKRIFISRVPGLIVNYDPPCAEKQLPPVPLNKLPKSVFPIVLLSKLVKTSDGKYVRKTLWLSHLCVNCLLLGGDTIKPSFWPKNK